VSDFEKWQGEIKKFCEERDWDQYHGPKDLAIGLVTEASELLEVFRFQSPDQSIALLNGEATRSDIADELADSLFFVLRFAQKYDISLGDALERKMKKNAAKYPVEKAKGRNQKYTEL